MKQLFVIALLGLFWAPAGFAAETHYDLHVNGLVCPFCEYNIEKKLGKLDGVEKVKADLRQGQVYVLVADGKTLPEEAVRKEITDAGFTLKSIESHHPGAHEAETHQ